MQRMRIRTRTAALPGRLAAPFILVGMSSALPVAAQDSPDYEVAAIRLRPDSIDLVAGERAHVEVLAIDDEGRPVEGALLLVSVAGSEASYNPVTGEVLGIPPGRTRISGRVRRPTVDRTGFEDVRAEGTVIVRPAPVTRLEVGARPERLYAGTRTRLRAVAYSGSVIRDDALITWQSSDPHVVSVGAGGSVTARRPGSARLTLAAEGVTQELELTVVSNPVRHLAVQPSMAVARVGDVVRVKAEAKDSRDEPVHGLEIEWTWAGLADQPYDALWMESEDPTSAVLVAHEPGPFRLTASAGSVQADIELEVTPRPPRRAVRLVAHGVVPQGHATTDLWVFEGLDGRDYVYTGTYSSNLMYAWDVTEPAQPVITDSVSFDGRRVNDVKINQGRDLAVVTSENAATRRNGITILDIREPAHPKRLSHYTEGLTGGVHNTWIQDDLVYAVHYGTRAVHIIDISDPARPRQVGRWNLPNEDRFLHDVTIVDGLAYLSYWDDGVVILDVGDGVRGGTPVAPAFVSQHKYSYRLGTEAYANTHHAIRYRDYVFAGDEIFDCAECINGPRGYVHVIDVSDIESPREVAWYRVPEAGVHNLWAEDDKLYIGYYQAGLRVLDISGELRGDLYRQGREIGWYMTEDDRGTVPNRTDTWGAQPYKGKIFASDGSSGLWIVELEKGGRPVQ